jgi:hypothetical protein
MPARAKSVRMTTSRINRRNPDVIDDAAAAGMQIYGDIWALPSWVLEKTVSTALAAKDAVKKHVKRALKNSVTWEGDSDVRKDLVFSAQRARNVAELARIYQAGKAKGYSDVTAAVEARARNLGLPMDKIKSPTSTGWGWNPARLADMQYARRKNPRTKKNSESGAAKFYEKFHGAPSNEEVIVENEIHEHEHLGVIGLLVAMVVDTPRGERVTISFESDGSDQVPWLCSSEDGCQLFIEGGDQTLDLAALGMDGEDWYKERMVIGRFAPPEPGRKWNLSYLTAKDFDQFEDIEYQHDLGEANEGEPKSMRREPPILEYEPLNKLLFISGGQYKIGLPLFGTSPGIEN